VGSAVSKVTDRLGFRSIRVSRPVMDVIFNWPPVRVVTVSAWCQADVQTGAADVGRDPTLCAACLGLVNGSGRWV
jgi:hypothetical protein